MHKILLSLISFLSKVAEWRMPETATVDALSTGVVTIIFQPPCYVDPAAKSLLTEEEKVSLGLPANAILTPVGTVPLHVSVRFNVGPNAPACSQCGIVWEIGQAEPCECR